MSLILLAALREEPDQLMMRSFLGSWHWKMLMLTMEIHPERGCQQRQQC
jgi:hypothetical protein